MLGVCLLLALVVSLALAPALPAQEDDEGLVGMLVVVERYQAIVTRCGIEIDSDFLAELAETANLLESYSEAGTRAGVARAIKAEPINCHGEAEWVRMLRRAEAGFLAQQDRQSGDRTKER